MKGGGVIKIPGRTIHECDSGILQRVNWLWKLIFMLNNYYHEADDVTEVMQSHEDKKMNQGVQPANTAESLCTFYACCVQKKVV